MIITNDCSKDDTEGAIRRYMDANPGLNIRYLKHEVNQGKGAALHTGIKHASGKFTVIQDADLEYDPAEYNILIKPILDGYADVVFGSRFMGGKTAPHPVLLARRSAMNCSRSYPVCSPT
jgi:glycosyltransferase involved in cell wall biosynthesis